MLKLKDRNKKRKLFKIKDIIKNNIYYNQTCKYKYNGFAGVAFCVDGYRLHGMYRQQTAPDFKKLLNNIINNYDNTTLIYTHSEYAHEIKETWLFIAN